VSAKCTVAEDAGGVRELLWAAVSAISPSGKQRRGIEATPVDRLHLYEGLVVWQQQRHRVVVGLVGS
jgi:hypothetical protein